MADLTVTWVPGCKLGLGWDILRNVAKDNLAFGSDLEQNLAPEEAYEVRSSTLSGEKRVLNTASDFAAMVQASMGASAKGWGASGKTSLEFFSDTHTSKESITCIIALRYETDPIIRIRSTAADIELNETALEKLRQEGPDVFEDFYGTHFIAGYTKGGIFVGSMECTFESVEKKLEAQASVTAAFGKIASASATFRAKVEESSRNASIRVSWHASGWTGELAPVSAQKDDIDALKEAHDKFKVNQGVHLEAVLAPYQALQSYQKARAEFFKGHVNLEDTGNTTFINVEHYRHMTDKLNDEYMRLEFLKRATNDVNASAQLKSFATKVQLVQDRFRTTLSNSDMRKVREAYQALDAYMYTVREEGMPLWFRGKDLHDELFRADALEEELKLINKVYDQPTLRLGQWTIEQDTKGHLRFKFLGNQQFVIHNDTDEANTKKLCLWERQIGYLAEGLINNNSPVVIKSKKDNKHLQNGTDGRAVFNTQNRGEWEEMYVERIQK